MSGFLDQVPLEKVKNFEQDLLEILKAKNRDSLDKISAGEWNDDLKNVIAEEAKIIAQRYQSCS